jgi:two-component system chemotaxis response regulator CheB
MINVLVADSSAVIRSLLKEIIQKTKKLSWVGEASSYSQFTELCAQIKPNVIIADKSLFDSDRNSTLSDYCSHSQIPTIIYYTANDKADYSSKNIRFIEKPAFINFSSEKIAEYASFLEQQVYDIKCNLLFENHPSSLASTVNEDGSLVSELPSLSSDYSMRNFKAVLVGVSTGGPGALLDFLKGIGANFPLPIFITQHIDSFFDKNLIEWLSAEALLPVELAQNNTKPLAGHVYFAPSDEHLTFVPYPNDDYHIVLNHDAPVNFLRPAVDKMFESAAKVFGKNCIAVVLTGMGADGAKECLHLKQLGAYTITQDEASCVIYGMPKAAFEMGASCEVLPLKQIPKRLWSLIKKDED